MFRIIKSNWLLLVLVLALPANWFLAFLVNNAALKQYEQKVTSQFVLTEDTVVLEVVSGCGNTAGTSNGAHLYVGVLIKTSLSEDSLRELYTKKEGIYAKVEKVTEGEKTTQAMQLLSLSLTHSMEEDENYYVVECFEDAPFYHSDLRGH